MTQALDVQPRHRVLEIGTGSGYQCAVLSRLARYVYSIERYRSLLADFGNQLGKKMRLDANLKLLERQGFITRKGEDIAVSERWLMPNLGYDN